MPATARKRKYTIFQDFYGRGQVPDAPTDAVPGSREKQAVLEQRAARRQQLHHERDRRIDWNRFWLGRLLA